MKRLAVVFALCLLGSIPLFTTTGCSNPPAAPAATATPTPVPTKPVWTFENNATTGWSVFYGPSASLAVTALGFNSTYGLNVIFAASPAGNDAQVAASGAGQGFPLNFTTLNAHGVLCYVNAAASAYTGGNGQYSVAAAPFLQAVSAGPTTVNYGGCYNGWANQNAQFGPNNTGNTWYTITLSPTGGTWSTDQTNVTAVGVEVNLANQVACNLTFDDVTVF